MVKKECKYYACDFETTVLPPSEHQVSTEVWASAVVELYTEDVHIFHSIQETWKYFDKISQYSDIVCYYHNLKFDGSFWLNYLIIDLQLKLAADVYPEPYAPQYEGTMLTWLKPRKMPNESFVYLIDKNGLWFYIRIKHNGHLIELRDSLKLIPFSISKIGKDFETKHRKKSMEYEGRRYAGCEITPEEAEYIACDVLVLKEALEIMFNSGHSKLTIGACCLQEFADGYDDPKMPYDDKYPNLYDMWLKKEAFGVDNAGRYIWRAYHGGWCYVADESDNRVLTDGITLDVNGLYSYVMHSMSGNLYPIGSPIIWEGNYIPNEACDGEHYYFVRIKTRFYIKKDMLPTIQIKGSMYYPPTKWLTSSDWVSADGSQSTAFFADWDGEINDTRVELTLTMTDFRMLKEHYNLIDFEILDGMYFRAQKGMFDKYIDKYQEIKRTSSGSKRTLAKLFLNNLYGKLAAGQNSSFKVAYVKDDGVLGFYQVREYDRKPGYIPIGAAITSYARAYTITAAQMNYHGKGNRGFRYADTDSIHCDLSLSEIQGIRVDSYALGAWKVESDWDRAIFVRQKTYIEHNTHENGVLLKSPVYNIKCAGMSSRCKAIFAFSLNGYVPDTMPDGTELKLLKEQKEFLYDKDGNVIKRDLTDFKIGLKIYGKLVPRMIKGGVLLVNTTYEMR